MQQITPKPVKEFTTEEPCSKVDLSNCFTRGGKYVRRAVVEARGEIGINAIKYLLKKGYANAVETDSIDWWVLTPSGEKWLAQGLARHLELHPADARKLTRNGAAQAPNKPTPRRPVRPARK